MCCPLSSSFSLCQGRGAVRNFFTASSDTQSFPSSDVIVFFLPVYLLSCLLHVSLNTVLSYQPLPPRLLLPFSRNYAALFCSLSSAFLSTCPANCSLLLTCRLSVKLLCTPVSSVLTPPFLCCLSVRNLLLLFFVPS